MSELPVSDDRVRRSAVDIIGLDRVTAAELVARLSAAGLDLGDDAVARIEDILESSSEFMTVGDDWVCSGAHLDGTCWVTEVDADDAEEGVLALDPNLCALGWWVDRALRLGDSDDVLESGDDLGDDVLVGPPGWLDRYAGRRVTVCVHADRLTLAEAEEVYPPPAALVGAVRAAFERNARHELVSDGSGEDVDLTQIGLEQLVWEALVSARPEFTTKVVPPIDELLAAAGLKRVGYTVMREEADVDALDRWHLRNQLAGVHHLKDIEIDLAETIISVSGRSCGEDASLVEVSPHAAAVVAVGLEYPTVCRAVLGWHLEHETDAAALAGFAQQVIRIAPSDPCAGTRWLEARALDLAGDAAGACAAFESAAATGTSHALVLRGLAAFRADAGDARAAVDALARTGVIDAIDAGEEPDDDVVELLEEVFGYAQQRPRPLARRNDPCPCGSGRKYKVCHLGKEQHSLIDRGPWLYSKHRRFVRDHERGLVAELARTISGAAGRGVELLLSLLDSELVADLALCEGEVAARFCAERDSLLPEDEALVAASWQLTERSLYQVEDVHTSQLALRDMRNGDRIVVTYTNAAGHTRRGDLMLGRPLPIADTWRAYSGFVKVGLALRDDVIGALDERNPFALAMAIGRCLAPPQVRNTDGHDLRFHEIVWRVPDPSVAARALASHEALEEDAGAYRLVRDTDGQPRTVIVTMTLDGEELKADVNSDERAVEVITLIHSVMPDAELVDHDVCDFDEAMAHTRAGAVKPAPNLLDDPKMADVRADIEAELERRWLDQRVPALGNRTPREAAQDPIGRHELEELLDTFDTGPGVMDSERLRRALGL